MTAHYNRLGKMVLLCVCGGGGGVGGGRGFTINICFNKEMREFIHLSIDISSKDSSSFN